MYPSLLHSFFTEPLDGTTPNGPVATINTTTSKNASGFDWVSLYSEPIVASLPSFRLATATIQAYLGRFSASSSTNTFDRSMSIPSSYYPSQATSCLTSSNKNRDRGMKQTNNRRVKNNKDSRSNLSVYNDVDGRRSTRPKKRRRTVDSEDDDDDDSNSDSDIQYYESDSDNNEYDYVGRGDAEQVGTKRKRSKVIALDDDDGDDDGNKEEDNRSNEKDQGDGSKAENTNQAMGEKSDAMNDDAEGRVEVDGEVKGDVNVSNHVDKEVGVDINTDNPQEQKKQQDQANLLRYLCDSVLGRPSALCVYGVSGALKSALLSRACLAHGHTLLELNASMRRGYTQVMAVCEEAMQSHRVLSSGGIIGALDSTTQSLNKDTTGSGGRFSSHSSSSSNSHEMLGFDDGFDIPSEGKGGKKDQNKLKEKEKENKSKASGSIFKAFVSAGGVTAPGSTKDKVANGKAGSTSSTANSSSSSSTSSSSTEGGGKTLSSIASLFRKAAAAKSTVKPKDASGEDSSNATTDKKDTTSQPNSATPSKPATPTTTTATTTTKASSSTHPWINTNVQPITTNPSSITPAGVSTALLIEDIDSLKLAGTGLIRAIPQLLKTSKRPIFFVSSTTEPPASLNDLLASATYVNNEINHMLSSSSYSSSSSDDRSTHPSIIRAYSSSGGSSGSNNSSNSQSIVSSSAFPPIACLKVDRPGIIECTLALLLVCFKEGIITIDNPLRRQICCILMLHLAATSTCDLRSALAILQLNSPFLSAFLDQCARPSLLSSSPSSSSSLPSSSPTSPSSSSHPSTACQIDHFKWWQSSTCRPWILQYSPIIFPRPLHTIPSLLKLFHPPSSLSSPSSPTISSSTALSVASLFASLGQSVGAITSLSYLNLACALHLSSSSSNTLISSSTSKSNTSSSSPPTYTHELTPHTTSNALSLYIAKTALVPTSPLAPLRLYPLLQPQIYPYPTLSLTCPHSSLLQGKVHWIRRFLRLRIRPHIPLPIDPSVLTTSVNNTSTNSNTTTPTSPCPCTLALEVVKTILPADNISQLIRSGQSSQLEVLVEWWPRSSTKQSGSGQGSSSSSNNDDNNKGDASTLVSSDTTTCTTHPSPPPMLWTWEPLSRFDKTMLDTLLPPFLQRKLYDLIEEVESCSKYSCKLQRTKKKGQQQLPLQPRNSSHPQRAQTNETAMVDGGVTGGGDGDGYLDDYAEDNMDVTNHDVGEGENEQGDDVIVIDHDNVPIDTAYEAGDDAVGGGEEDEDDDYDDVTTVTLPDYPELPNPEIELSRLAALQQTRGVESITDDTSMPSIVHSTPISSTTATNITNYGNDRQLLELVAGMAESMSCSDMWMRLRGRHLHSTRSLAQQCRGMRSRWPDIASSLSTSTSTTTNSSERYLNSDEGLLPWGVEVDPNCITSSSSSSSQTLNRCEGQYWTEASICSESALLSTLTGRDEDKAGNTSSLSSGSGSLLSMLGGMNTSASSLGSGSGSSGGSSVGSTTSGSSTTGRGSEDEYGTDEPDPYDEIMIGAVENALMREICDSTIVLSLKEYSHQLDTLISPSSLSSYSHSQSVSSSPTTTLSAGNSIDPPSTIPFMAQDLSSSQLQLNRNTLVVSNHHLLSKLVPLLPFTSNLYLSSSSTSFVSSSSLSSSSYDENIPLSFVLARPLLVHDVFTTIRRIWAAERNRYYVELSAAVGRRRNQPRLKLSFDNLLSQNDIIEIEEARLFPQ